MPLPFGRVAEANARANNPGRADSRAYWRITEASGPVANRQSMVMAGSLLPEKPFSYHTGQRLKVTAYPNSRVNSIQVLGPDYGSLHVTGRINEQDFDRGSAQCFVELVKSGSGLNGPTKIQSASVIKSKFEAWADEGAFLKIQLVVPQSRSREEGLSTDDLWDDTTYYGAIESFDPTIEFAGLYTYELKFAIQGKLSVTTKTAGAKKKPPSTMSKLMGLVGTAQSIFSDMKLAVAEIKSYYQDYVVNSFNKVQSTIDNLSAFSSSVIGLTALPADLAKRQLGLVSACQDAVSQFTVDLIGVASQYTAVGDAWVRTAAPVNQMFIPFVVYSDRDQSSTPEEETTNAVAMLSFNRVARQLRDVLASMARAAVESSDMYSDANIIALHNVHYGDTLRGLSNKYYQSPDMWQIIADFNDLPSDSLSVGMVILIPEVT